MLLSYVGTECGECGHEDFVTSCEFSRILNLPLTDHSAAFIPRKIGCQSCHSEKISVKSPNPKTYIVDHRDLRFCEYCDSAIPQIFRISFPEARFCPICVANDKITDNQIIMASGQLFKDEAFWKMSLQFKDSTEELWLRKAVENGNSMSCFTLANKLLKNRNQEDRDEAAKLLELGLAKEKSSESTRNAEFKLGILHFDNLISDADLNYGLELINRSAKNGAAYAMEKLGLIYFLGLNGIQQDRKEGFRHYFRALKEYPDYIHLNATVGLCHLYGDGCKANFNLAQELLEKSLERFVKFRMGDKIDVVRKQLIYFMKTSSVEYGYSDEFKKFVRYIGGSNSPYHEMLSSIFEEKEVQEPSCPHELRFVRALPRGVKRTCYDVKDDAFINHSNRDGTIGQIEEFDKNLWVGVTFEGEVLDNHYRTEREAAEALANKVGSRAVYVHIFDKLKRLQDN